MSPVVVVVGLVLGALGGAAHLAVTRARATLAVGGRGLAALALLPLGFAAIGGAVVLAARFDRQAAWFVPIGLLVARFLVLRALRGRP